jgi:hypothetical protein
MEYRLRLDKMTVEHRATVNYFLKSNSSPICVNNLIGNSIQFIFQNRIVCMNCGKKTTKSFMSGYCFRCFQTSAETSPCILKPELCQAHLGHGRDINWEKKHHLQPHIVYLSYTGNVKVGVTKKTNSHSRWIDQGALAAIVLAETQNRYQAGCIEVALKEILSDRTSWQAMLKTNTIEADLLIEKKRAAAFIYDKYKAFISPSSEVVTFKYPKLSTPAKIKSLNLDKSPIISGTLTGIKGQYFYLDNEFVFNVRRHSGYEVLLKF